MSSSDAWETYGQGPIVSPCCPRCAFSACALTVIVWNGCCLEPVWWQIVTRPAYPYPGPSTWFALSGLVVAAHAALPAMLAAARTPTSFVPIQLTPKWLRLIHCQPGRELTRLSAGGSGKPRTVTSGTAPCDRGGPGRA